MSVQRSASFFCEEPDSKYSRLHGLYRLCQKTTQLCQHSGEAATDKREMNGNDRPPIKLYLQSRQQARLSLRATLGDWGGGSLPT